MNKKPKMIYLGRRKGFRNIHYEQKPSPTWIGYDRELEESIIIQILNGLFIYKRGIGYNRCYDFLREALPGALIGRIYMREDLPLLHERFGVFPKCKKENKVLKVIE